MRGRSDKPPKQSPFTEARGKRQQYDIADISDDDDDDDAYGDPGVQQCDPEVNGVLDDAATVRRAHHGVIDDGAVADERAVTTCSCSEEKLQQGCLSHGSHMMLGSTNIPHGLLGRYRQD